MRDAGFILEPAAETAQPPFSYTFSLPRHRAFCWYVRERDGRAIARANTRAGARAAIKALYRLHGEAGRTAPLKRTARAEALKPRRWTPPGEAMAHG